MTNSFKLIGLGAATLMAVTSTANAQTRPAAARPAAAAAARPAIAQGPAIPGVCVFSVNQTIGASSVGQYIHTRLEQIVAQVKAELSPEDTSIATDVKALEAQRASLDAATYQTRGQAIQVRINALREKADLRQREVKATEDKALNRVAQELEPIAQAQYQQHRCSILLDRGSVMMTNPEMDLTPGAVTALNAKIQQFPFDREHLDAGGAAPAR